MTENQPENNIEKPAILYHGSPHSDIEELEPRSKSHRDPKEGPLVFASPDLATASIFLLDGVSESGFFNNVPYAIIVGPREEFVKKDHGGHIYVLPGDTFINDPNKGLGKYEWTSKEKVKPKEVIEYKSSLDATIENGIQVYFISETIYDDIQNSEDHGLKILSDLESENQRRGMNVKKIVEKQDKNKKNIKV